MNIKDYIDYSVIIKTEDDSDEILRTTVSEKIKGEDVIAIDCNPKIFEHIDKAIVVFYNKDEAVQYKGTIRRVNYLRNRVEIALHHGEEYKNRTQSRFEVNTEIELLRRMDREGNITPLRSVSAELLDISNGGAGFMASSDILETGDLCAFILHNKAIKRFLFGKVVRKTKGEGEMSKYGALLFTENEVREAGFFKDINGGDYCVTEASEDVPVKKVEEDLKDVSVDATVKVTDGKKDE